MADESQTPKPLPPSTPPAAAGDKPPGAAPPEPLKAEPSRTQSSDETPPGSGDAKAGASRAEAPTPATGAKVGAGSPAAPPAPKPTPAAAAGAPKPAAAGAAKPAAHAATPAAPAGPPDPPPPADLAIPSFIKGLQAAFGESAIGVSFFVGDFTVVVSRELVLDVLRHLRDAPEAAFDMLSDLTATDWPPRAAERFDIIYCLWSTRHRHRLRVKTKVGEQPLPSATAVWPAANWLEREVFDMFGVNFTGHPDRRRILMPDDWQGHPQRKDYPLEGPGELLMENPIDWLKVRQAADEADIE